jgi:hypothetical protein
MREPQQTLYDLRPDDWSPLGILEQVPDETQMVAIRYRIEGGESVRGQAKGVSLNDVLSTVSFQVGGNLP